MIFVYTTKVDLRSSRKAEICFKNLENALFRPLDADLRQKGRPGMRML